jgi:serine/threonine-protein kinase
MSEDLRAGDGTLPLSAERRVDRVCERFEDAWIAGQRPLIEDYLADTPEPERAALLRELLKLEREYRCRKDERPTPEEYRPRFPADESLILLILGVGPASAAPSPAPPLSPPATARLAKAQETGQDPNVTGPAAAADEPPDGGPPAAPDPDLPAIPGYRILGVLGKGGMGVVYKAWQEGLKRLVALKRIKERVAASPERLALFQREAEAVARLNHPNIVQIYQRGAHGGRPYFVMELVEGGSLEKRLAGTPQPARLAAGLAEALARAVHIAHQAGIVHRDLKPANVLLARQGGSLEAG